MVGGRRAQDEGAAVPDQPGGGADQLAAQPVDKAAGFFAELALSERETDIAIAAEVPRGAPLGQPE